MLQTPIQSHKSLHQMHMTHQMKCVIRLVANYACIVIKNVTMQFFQLKCVIRLVANYACIVMKNVTMQFFQLA